MIEISCREVTQEISNYLEGEVDPGLRARISEHLKDCRHCTAILDGTRNVIRLAVDDRIFTLPAGFSQRLYQKLKANSA